MNGGFLRRWPMLVALIVMWIALWGDLSVANILGGAIVAVAVLAFADQVKPGPVHNLGVVAALRYLQTFTMQLLVASWEVIKAIVDPRRVRPGIIAMPLRHASDAVVTLVANSITLTPGTLTLETERRGDVAILYVHALDISDPDSVRRDIAALELRAVDAFAGPDTQALQARSLAELEGREQAGASSGVVWPDDDAGDSAAATIPPRVVDGGRTNDGDADAGVADAKVTDNGRVDVGGAGDGDADDADDGKDPQ